MSIKLHTKAIIGGIGLFLVVSGGVVVLAHRHIGNEVALQETSPKTASAADAQVTPAPTTLSDVQADTSGLSGAVQAILANFYIAYEDKDAARLESLFTPDTTAQELDLRSRFFTGKTSAGVTAGPTLFVDANLQENPLSYGVVATDQVESKWVITVDETRAVPSDQPPITRTTILTFTPAGAEQGGWLIDSYAQVGSTGKYNGFLTQ